MCEQNTLTRVFSRTFVHSSFAHMHLHGSKCRGTCLCKKSAHPHVITCLIVRWSLHPLISSSLSSVSTSCPISSPPLFCSSSMWSEPPSNMPLWRCKTLVQSPVHPQNEEYGPVVIQNPLTMWPGRAEPCILRGFLSV